MSTKEKHNNSTSKHRSKPACRETGGRQDGNREQDDEVFKALANADRRSILDLLRDAPQTTGAICSALLHLDRCTVMLHLKKLEQARLVISKRQGRMRWNFLNVEPIEGVYRRWISAYAQPASQLLMRWKEELES